VNDITIKVIQETTLEFTTPGGEFEVEMEFDLFSQDYILTLAPAGVVAAPQSRHRLNKIEAIKWLRTLTGRGLREAKQLVDQVDYVSVKDRVVEVNPFLETEE